MSNARSFSVNTSNFVKVAPGTQSVALANAPATSLSMWVRLTNPTATGDSYLYQGYHSFLAGPGIVVLVRKTSGQNAALQVGGRSTIESLRSTSFTSKIVPVGTWQHLGFVLDYFNAKLKIYLNGAKVTDVGAPFNELSYHLDQPAVASEAFAGRTNNSTDAMLSQTQCDMAAVTFWNTDIGDSGFTTLASGSSHSTTSSSNIVLHFPLDCSNPELETIAGATVTVGGSVPCTDGPPITSGQEHNLEASISGDSDISSGLVLTYPLEASISGDSTVSSSLALKYPDESMSLTALFEVSLQDYFKVPSPPLAAWYFKIPLPDYNGHLQRRLDGYLTSSYTRENGIPVTFNFILNHNRQTMASMCLRIGRGGIETTLVSVYKVCGDSSQLLNALTPLVGFKKTYRDLLPGAAVILFLDESVVPLLSNLEVELELPLVLREENCLG